MFRAVKTNDARKETMSNNGAFDWTPYRGGSHDFAKFETEGDGVTGVIVAIRQHVFDADRGPVPLLDLEKEDGEIVTLSADKVDLRQQLADIGPQVGDKLRVKFTEWAKTPNGNRKKVFEVNHRAGERKPHIPEPPQEELEPF
jgi:hypothetical protein